MSFRLQPLRSLSDRQLANNLIGAHATERYAGAEVVAYLVELERRQLHLSDGYSSLFEYCTNKLGMSEDVAGTRIGAARVAAEYPCVLEMLADGRLYLSGLRLLKPHLNADNHRELLEAAASKSKRAIDKLLAERFAKPDVPASIRKLPSPKASSSPSSDLLSAARRTKGTTEPSPAEPLVDLPPTPPPPTGCAVRADVAPSSPAPQRSEPLQRAPKRTASQVPLSAHRYKVTFTASEELVGKLERAQALLSHVIGPDDLEGVFDRALTMLIAVEEKRRFGAARARRKPNGRAPQGATVETGWAREPAEATEQDAGTEAVGEAASAACSP